MSSSLLAMLERSFRVKTGPPSHTCWGDWSETKDALASNPKESVETYIFVSEFGKGAHPRVDGFSSSGSHTSSLSLAQFCEGLRATCEIQMLLYNAFHFIVTESSSTGTFCSISVVFCDSMFIYQNMPMAHDIPWYFGIPW